MKYFVYTFIIIAFVYSGFSFVKKRDGVAVNNNSQLTLRPITNDSLVLGDNAEENYEVESVATTSMDQNEISPPTEVATNVVAPASVSNVQLIKGTITWEEGLIPAEFTVKKGIPVRFEIDPKDDIEGCMSTILVEELYENYHFIQAGKKIVMEFTPNRAGEYYIVCAMGVEFGKITVEK